jgi:hypothetical protein
MLKKIELNFSKFETQNKGIKIAGAIALVAVLVIGSTLFLNNVIATPVSPREVQLRTWVNALHDQDLTTQRQEAQTQLEAAGAEAVPALTTALRSNDQVMRANAADMLGFIASPLASDALQQTLNQDPVPSIRTNAAYALGAIKTSSGLNALDRASAVDTSPTVRQAASTAADTVRASLAQRAGQDLALVQAITVAPGQPNTVYLATKRDLIVSHDGGTKWNTLSQTLPSLASTLAVNPTNPDIVYAGMYSLGMALSTDGGRTWQSLTRNFSNEAIGGSTVTAITVDPSDPMRVVMAHGILIGDASATFFPLGILSSKDGGQTWANVLDLQEGQQVTRLSISDGKVYAVAGDKVLIAPLAN